MTIRADQETCIALLVRHGATPSNLADPPILQGRTIDGSLSAEGQRQAERAAACLAQRPLTAIYSSPLKRARETAQRIAEPHGLTVRIIAEITEADVGAWERRSWVEIQQSEPEHYENFQRDPARHGYRDGENLAQVAARVIPALEQTASAHLGHTIAIVGHNVVNRVFLAHALQLPLAQARSIAQQNCGINTLRYRHGRFKVLAINSLSHLLEE
jgi:broad specificity phosphatase PhoE